MKHCSNCNIDLKTTRKTCPLCFKYLDECEALNETPLQEYPKKTTKSKMPIAIRSALFISIVACIASVIVNIMTFKLTGKYYWSAVVVLGTPYIWLMVLYVILGRGLLVKRLTSITVSTVLLVLLIEFCVCLVNGNNRIEWSLNYVIPITLVAGMLSIHIISAVRKDLYPDSVLFMLEMSFIGLIPYILFLTTDLIDVGWPSVGCAAISVFVFLAMLIFNYRETRDELKKIFHI